MALPLAHATESTLRLSVAEPNVEASLAGGTGIATTRATDERKTEITVVGAAGDVQLAWRPKLAGAVTGTGQLDANGEISVRVQSEPEPRLAPGAAVRVRLPRARCRAIAGGEGQEGEGR